MPDVTALPQPGDVFAGKYLIERVIGTGKASLVFSARHGVTGKRFAIEWLLPGVIDTRHDAVIDGDEDSDDGLAADSGTSADEAAESHEEEARDADDLLSDLEESEHGEHRVVGHFRHPNVLEVYDVGEASGSLYTVMEWAEGESLEARIQRAGPMSLSEASRLLVPSLRGMHEAHAAGILHRDLKPSNIYIYRATRSTGEVVKVLDFEVIDAVDGDTASVVLRRATTSNKPYYRAPEQFSDVEVDHRADVYAFGAILYEALSGRPPFAPMSHVNRDELTPTRLAALQARTDKLPLGADAIVGRAMARDVSQRFQTLHELADALEAFSRPHVAQRGMITGRTQLSAESIRQLANRPTPQLAAPGSLELSFANEPSVSRGRPWPRPPSIPDQPVISPEPLAEEEPPPNELEAAPTAPEWSEPPSARETQKREWSEAPAPRPSRRANQPAPAHTPFYYTDASLEPTMPNHVLPSPVARVKGVYIASAVAVVAIAGLLVSRYWESRDKEVVASFDAVSASPESVVELPASRGEPNPLPPTASPEVLRPSAPTDELPSMQALEAATAQLQAEQQRFAQLPNGRSGDDDPYAAPGDLAADGPVYRLPLKAPGTDPTPRRARPAELAPAPAVKANVPPRAVQTRVKPAPAPKARVMKPQRGEQPSAAAAGSDQIPMQLM